MPRIIIDLPDWAIGRHITIMAGTELLGQMEYRVEKNRINGQVVRKRYYLPYKQKPGDGRCSGCGDCCNSGGPKTLQLIADRVAELGYAENKRCPMLDDHRGCILGTSIPLSCATSNCQGWSENCTERLDVLDNDIIMLEMI